MTNAKEEYTIKNIRMTSYYTDRSVPSISLKEVSGTTIKDTTSNYLFKDKKVVIFSVPGAFTPTCSSKQVPDFDKEYEQFIKLGISNIYCISVNDPFVMSNWYSHLKINSIKFISDYSSYFTKDLGMLVDKSHLGMGMRSWRYVALIDNMLVKAWFEEPGRNILGSYKDPYGETSPKKILEYLKINMK